MSLKAFHIFFISLVTLGSGAFGWWAWTQYRLGSEGQYLGLALCALLMVLSLPTYGTWFLKKMKSVSFL